MAIAGGDQADLRRAIESDFRSRWGTCRCGCGLMGPCDYSQECPTCHFFCNTLPELTAQ